jgi:polyisoprenoid-binding protein YceI
MTTATVARTTRTTWVIDPTHSNVEFSAKHLMITTVKGRFGGVRGTLIIDETNPKRSSAEVTVDARSIDTRTEQRDQHLRSPDFLDVERYPEITFRSTVVKGRFASPGDRFSLVGTLTIHGASREVELDTTFEGQAKDPWGGQRVSFSAIAKIDRRDFGLTWNQALETGGILVGNEIKIAIEVQATQTIEVR